jgi:hypothetical protein
MVRWREGKMDRLGNGERQIDKKTQKLKDKTTQGQTNGEADGWRDKQM